MANNTRKISKRRSDRRKTRTTKKHKEGGGVIANRIFSNIAKSTGIFDIANSTRKGLSNAKTVISTGAKKVLSDMATSTRKGLSGAKAVISTGTTAASSRLNALRQGTDSVIGNTTSGVIKTLSQVKNTLKRPFTKIAKYPDESHHNRFFIGKREPNKTQFSISEYEFDRNESLNNLLQNIKTYPKEPGVYTLSYFFKIEEKDGKKKTEPNN